MCERYTPIAAQLRLGPFRWPWPPALRALAYRNYRLFWSGQLVSLTGMWMQQTAQQWLVYRLTGSALMLGVVSIATFLPLLLLSPFAGLLADRVDRRRWVLIAQVLFLAQALILAALTLSGLVQVWHILVLALFLGVVDTFEKPLRQVLVGDLVRRADMTNAVALHAVVFNVARLTGPALAGVVIAWFGEAANFVANAITFIPVILGLHAIRSTTHAPLVSALGSLAQIREGFVHVMQSPAMSTLMAMVFLHGLFGLPYTVLMPVLAGTVLRIGPQGLGMLFAAAGTGAVIGGMTLARLRDGRRRGQIVTGAMLVFSLALVVLALSRWLPLSLAALAVLGWSQLLQLATTNALLQELAPEPLRGRVISTMLWMQGSALPLGSLLIGLLAEHWGAPPALCASGVACGACALLFAWRLRAQPGALDGG